MRIPAGFRKLNVTHKMNASVALLKKCPQTCTIGDAAIAPVDILIGSELITVSHFKGHLRPARYDGEGWCSHTNYPG